MPVRLGLAVGVHRAQPEPLLAAHPPEQRGEQRRHGGERRGAPRSAQVEQRRGDVPGQVEGEGRATAGAAWSARAVRGQVERRQIREHALPEPPGVVEPPEVEAPPLLGGEVREPPSGRGRVGHLTCLEGCIRRAELSHEQGHGPSVRGDMVLGDQQSMLPVAQPHEGEPHRRLPRQVERRQGLLCTHPVQLALSFVDGHFRKIHDRQRRLERIEQLRAWTSAPVGEAGPQRLVTAHEQGDRLPDGGDRDLPAGQEFHVYVVQLPAVHEPVQEPQAALACAGFDRRAIGLGGLGGRGFVLGSSRQDSGEERSEGPHRGMLEQGGQGDVDAQQLHPARTQLRSHQRIQAQLRQGQVWRHVLRVGQGQRTGDLPPQEFLEPGYADVVGERAPVLSRGVANGGSSATCGLDHPAHRRRHGPRGQGPRHGCHVEGDEHGLDLVRGHRIAEEIAPERGLQSLDSGPLEALPSRFAEALDHTAAGPRTPHQGVRRKAGGAPLADQRLDERVGRRVAPLPRGAEQGRHGREHREQREIQVSGELVQVPRPRHLGREHRGQAIAADRRDRRVVQHPGGVHDPDEGRFHGAEEAGQGHAVGDIDPSDRHVRTRGPQQVHGPGRHW